MSEGEKEFYPTPRDLAKYLFERFLWQVPSEMFVRTDENGDNVPVQILEPSAGKGAFAMAMASLGHCVTAIDPHFDDPKIEGVDWERISLEDLHELLEGDCPFDLACGNPPFSLAEAHLRLLLKMVRVGGYIGFLLRSGFLGSAKRSQFFKIYPPKHIYILPRRPSFVWSWKCKECSHKWLGPVEEVYGQCPKCGNENLGLSKTDQYDYMFAIWEVGLSPSHTTTLSWLHAQEGEEDNGN